MLSLTLLSLFLTNGETYCRCHADASGYVGPWSPTPVIFNNNYFTLLKVRSGLCVAHSLYSLHSLHSLSVTCVTVST